MTTKALFLTIVVGIFFIIGMVIPKLFKNKNKLIVFTTGLTFIIMLALIVFDLFPEILEVLDPLHNLKNALLTCIFIFLGLLILKILDLFVPEHHHEHHEKNDNLIEHNDHLFHIGLITAISLMIHNILEGISIYITGINDFKLGVLMAISVGCHNLPLGIEIAANMEVSQKNKFTKFLILSLLVISSFLGAFILFIANKDLNEMLEGILLSMTLGMLFYISMFEILSEVKLNWRKKELKLGLLVGIIIAILLFLI